MKWVWTQPISESYHMPTSNLSSRPSTHYKIGASRGGKFMKVWTKGSQYKQRKLVRKDYFYCLDSIIQTYKQKNVCLFCKAL